MNRIKLGSFAGEQVFMAVEGEAAQDIMESAQHIPQQANHEIKPCTVDTCIDRDYHKVCRMQSCSSYTGLTS
jgi:hypothetical protein